MNITQQMRSLAANGHIPLTSALQLAAAIDEEREKTIKLLRDCEREVGLYNGEKINVHLAEMQGTYFNERDYHYERPVGEQ